MPDRHDRWRTARKVGGWLLTLLAAAAVVYLYALQDYWG
jgi:hypothetical protein